MLKYRQPFVPQDDYFNHGPYPVLMLEFEAEIPPGEISRLEILTKTAAFMERDRLFTYGTSQARYTFHYYLSPARYWAGFKDLDVVLKTSSAAPLLKESNLDFHWAGWRHQKPIGTLFRHPAGGGADLYRSAFLLVCAVEVGSLFGHWNWRFCVGKKDMVQNILPLITEWPVAEKTLT